MDFKGSLKKIADRDVETLVQKEKSYGSSWKKRGGVGAFMMLARKWDRIENTVSGENWDLFQGIENTPGEEGLLDDIRDLRCYLLLVEEEMTDKKETAPRPREEPFGYNPKEDKDCTDCVHYNLKSSQEPCNYCLNSTVENLPNFRTA